MEPLWVIAGIGCTLLLLWTVAILAQRSWKRLGLHEAAQARLRQQWHHAVNLPDHHRKILEADKVLHTMLSEMKFDGTTGDKLKAAGEIIPDLQAVWNAHKLRNRIAHEPGVHLEDREVAAALRAYEKAIRKFVPL